MTNNRLNRVYYSSCEYGMTYLEAEFVDHCSCCAIGEHLTHHARIELQVEGGFWPLVYDIEVGTFDNEDEAIDAANEWLWAHYKREEDALYDEPMNNKNGWVRLRDMMKHWKFRRA